MTAQHITHPHSADQIEHTHHVESSEGHQVPGPPHSHGHDGHHGPDTGPVVAVIVIALLLIGAAWIGLRAPEVGPEGHVAPRPAAAGEEGVVVLDDGRVFSGLVSAQPKTVTVRSEEHGELVLPSDRVRWMRTGGTTLTDEYWRQFGHLPVEATRAARGGGIVVLDDGEVFVGRVLQGERGLTIRLANGGEVTVPRERVRFFDLDRETLSEEYWRQFGDQPIDPRWQRGEARPAPERDDRRGSARPEGARDKRAAARLAQASSRWSDATAAWAELYRDKQLPSDLTNLLTCTDRLLAEGFATVPAKPTTERVRALLEPLAHVPVVREKLASAYFDTAMYYVGVHDVAQTRRWATALQGIGDPKDAAPYLLRAAAEIERFMDEEAAEHDEDEEGEHGH